MDGLITLSSHVKDLVLVYVSLLRAGVGNVPK